MNDKNSRKLAPRHAEVSITVYPKRFHRCRLILPSLGVVAFGLQALAQSYSIDWSKISGGGGVSTGGAYSVSGTIGQHDAALTSTGGNYSLTGGFWGVYAIQAAGAPLLTITNSANIIVISWPSSAVGFNLQMNTDPATTNWTTAPAPTDNGVIKFITINAPTGNRFYRLKSP